MTITNVWIRRSDRLSYVGGSWDRRAARRLIRRAASRGPLVIKRKRVIRPVGLRPGAKSFSAS